MQIRSDYIKFKEILNKYDIKCLYHFTDAANLESIVSNRGLYSWGECQSKKIHVECPGGSDKSHEIDKRQNLQFYTRISFCKYHPMMFMAMKDGRIKNPVILEIDTDVLLIEGNIFSNKNATRSDSNKGKSYDDFCQIHFETIKKASQFEVDENEQEYYQAELLVNHYIPIHYILNINKLYNKQEIKITNYNKLYKAPISEYNPQSVFLLINPSVDYFDNNKLNNDENTSIKVAVEMVDKQMFNPLNHLLIKSNKRNYKITSIGYGNYIYAYNSPNKDLSFINKWLYSYDEKENIDEAIEYISPLIKEQIKKNPYSNPPIVINITGCGFDRKMWTSVIEMAEKLKTLKTHYGFPTLINIIFNTNNSPIESVYFPQSVYELGKYYWGEIYYLMSSVLPSKYKSIISKYNKKVDETSTHSGLIFGVDIDKIPQIIEDIISIS